ncbi:primase-helicase family protein [uncultured Ruegeria sp.]|uniref:primase-helicase family protein n=1 Tax=uncultured Ruegeria sp. TaxID=259304 RepID=UPI00260840BA|nr:primase-helicase family protein [uncultured Ruegeria sp.]
MNAEKLNKKSQVSEPVFEGRLTNAVSSTCEVTESTVDLLGCLVAAAMRQGYYPALVLLHNKKAFQANWPNLRPTVSEAREHILKDPKQNAIGVQPASLGCVVLDCDEGDGPAIAAEIMEEQNGDVVACVTPSSSRRTDRGHVWMRCDDPESVGNWPFRIDDPIYEVRGDLRSSGGNVRLTDAAMRILTRMLDIIDGFENEAAFSDFSKMRTSEVSEIDPDFDREDGYDEVTKETIAALGNRLDGPDGTSRYTHLLGLVGDIKRSGASFNATLDLFSNHVPLWPDENGERDGKFDGTELQRHLVLAWKKTAPYVSAEDDFDDEIENLSLVDTPPGPLERMNQRYTVVDVEGKTRVAYKLTEEDPYDGTSATRWIFATKVSFFDYHENKRMEVTNAKGVLATAPVAREWLKWGQRNTAKGIVFSPNRDVDGMLNLWTGFGCEPREGATDMIHWIIRDSLCGGDPEAYNYVLDWLAYGVQNPEELIGVALAFYGAKGTGKTTLGELMVSIYGMHGLALSSREQLTGQFNGHMGTCCLAFCDEIDFHFSSGKEDSRLKKIVTDRKGMMEKKGIDARAMNNRSNVLISGNSDHSVPATADERRYAVIKVPNTWGTGSAAPNRNEAQRLHGKVHEQIRNGGREAFLAELLARKIDRHPRESIPQNAALVEQKIHGLSLVQRWFFDACEEGKLPTPDDWTEDFADMDDVDGWEAIDQFTTPTAVLNAIELWKRGSEKFRRSQMPSRRAVLVELRQFGVINGIKHNQQRAWKIPSLPEVRRAWIKLLGGDPFAD